MATSTITRFEKASGNGWTVNMHAVEVGGGDLAVYSPTWLGQGTFERLDAIGRPTVLIAPNHYHHLSLQKFRERYPEATAVAGTRAMPRLAKKGHRGLRAAADLSGALPERVRIIECPATKSGELWVEIDDNGQTSWLVGDAFFNAPGPVTGLAGLFLRATQSAPGLCIGRQFPWFVLEDTQTYADWLGRQLRQRPPAQLFPSHGVPLQGAGVQTQLKEVVEGRFGH